MLKYGTDGQNNDCHYEMYYESLNEKTFFTSDTHFGSSRALEYSRRPFDSVLEMDSTLIDNWNSKVGKNDTVIHLGDFGATSAKSHLNGNIFILPGNNDKKEELIKVFGKENVLIKGKFGTHMTVKNNSSLQTFYIMHEPEHMRSNHFNLFGHVHQLSMVKRVIMFKEMCRGLNVGVDCHFFRPIDMTTVSFYKDAVEHRYDYNVFM